jgi:drug/metabolite transporter (DMT)-like permease
LQTPDPQKSGTRLVFGGMLLSGIGPALVRNSPVDFAATAFWRLAIALPIAFIMARHSVRLPLRSILWAAGSGFFLGLDLVLWNGAVMHTTILESTVLVMLYPLLVALGGWLILREAVTARLGIGGGIAFLGLVLMTANAGFSSAGVDGNSRLFGDLLAIVAAFTYAGSLLISSRLCRKHEPVAVTFWVMSFAALCALPFALFQARPYPTTPEGWLYIAFYGAVTLASYSLFNRGLKTVPAALAAVIGYGQPVIATLLAFLFMHETPTLIEVAGSAVIIAGLAVATLQPKRSLGTVEAKPAITPVSAE